MRQMALDFCQSLKEFSNSPAAQNDMARDLVRWLNFKFAAIASAFDTEDCTSGAALDNLHRFSADVCALRRGDQSAARLAIAERRLALLESDSSQQKEKDFWKWLERPDIKAKLNKTKEKNRFWRQAMINVAPEIAHLLPSDFDSIDDSFENTDPAALI
jgi:hypothetical protein